MNASLPPSPSHPAPALTRRAKVTFIIGSLILVVLLAEAILRLMLPVERVVGAGIDDRSWQYMWIAGRAADKAAGRLTGKNPLMTLSPTLGWRPKPFAERDGFRLNSRGLRGGREYDAKRPGERRALVVGDSYTFAGRYSDDLPAIQDDSIYTAVIERGLPGTTVINLGVPGYGTDQMLLYLREEGLRYEPDLVVLTLFVDNLYRALLNFRDYAKPRFDLEQGTLTLRNVPLPPPEELERELPAGKPLSYGWLIGKIMFRRITDRFASLGTLEVDKLNAAILDAFREEVRRRDVPLLVVMIPAPEQTPALHRSERIVKAWGERAEVPVLLLRDSFHGLSPADRARLYIDHLTPFGHEIAGQAILERIRADQLVP